MKIAVTSKDYPIKRNILDKLNYAEYNILKNNNNLYHTISTIIKILSGKKKDFTGKYFFFGRKDIDILHLYNGVNYSDRNWVSCFETLIPRFEETKDHHQSTEPSHTVNKKTDIAIKQISKKNCLGIIAISQASANIQKKLFSYYPHYKEICEKLHVLHPPQEVIGKRMQKDKTYIQLIFIGTQFHLKGGIEMIEVLKLLKPKYNFKLILISRFSADTYVTKVTKEEALKSKEEIIKLDWIDYYENLSNSEVINLIQQSHVGLLPTWSDTYGFSVLEMQACGVPVITTDVRALPEINSDICGWIIKVPKNKLKQGLYFTPEQKKIFKSTIKTHLYKILEDIFQNPQQISKKGDYALERIKVQHDPKIFAEKLLKIYEKGCIKDNKK